MKKIDFSKLNNEQVYEFWTGVGGLRQQFVKSGSPLDKTFSDVQKDAMAELERRGCFKNNKNNKKKIICQDQ